MTALPIDLRSDTVTRPSEGMRRAMAAAEVGDDVLDGDPTTRRLERATADLLGLEDALFFPSGTQANGTGIALCTRPGTELVLEANAHLVTYELAGVAALWGGPDPPRRDPRWPAHRRAGAPGPASRFAAPAAGDGGGRREHPQRRGRPGLAFGGDGRHCGGGAAGGIGRPPRWRPALECRRGAGGRTGTGRAGGDYGYGELF